MDVVEIIEREEKVALAYFIYLCLYNLLAIYHDEKLANNILWVWFGEHLHPVLP